MVDATMHRWVNYLRQIRRDKKETNSSTSKIQKKPKTRGTRRESPKLYIENIHQRFDKLKKKTNISIVKICKNSDKRKWSSIPQISYRKYQAKVGRCQWS